MRTKLLLFLVVISLTAFAQFDQYFLDKTLRVDYFHAGNHETETYYLDEVKSEPFWGGSKVNLVDTFEYGKYFFKVFDITTDELIYSRGYSTLFGEWQTVAEAKKIWKSFSETVVMPYPRNDAKIEFYSRNRKGMWEKKFEYFFQSGNYFISPERKLEYPSFDVHVSGDPAKKVDIVILPEGYTADEMGLFINDCETFAKNLFMFSPYTENRDKFNIRGVLAPSWESGSDIPADSIWQKTITNTSFYTFDSERYCMTYDNKSVRDLASNAPYDQIYILVNHPKYGGGGIYNDYCVSVNSNIKAAKIFVHEFGHGFAGLGDEYVGTVSYSEFYPIDVEPWEPNITTLVDFDSKWKHLMDNNTPIPTPEEKKYWNTLGVFEGAGYAKKGIYRPAHDCLMNTFKGDVFCGACYEAIERMIDFYCE
jgi:hypothetical protein